MAFRRIFQSVRDAHSRCRPRLPSNLTDLHAPLGREKRRTAPSARRAKTLRGPEPASLRGRRHGWEGPNSVTGAFT